MQVYLTTNMVPNHPRNGWQYIGYDTYDNPTYYGSSTLLEADIKTCCKQFFPKTLLENNTCNGDLLKLIEQEIYWIAFYNTYLGRGYNKTPGGDGWPKGVKFSEEHKQKLREARLELNFVYTKEMLEKMRIGHTGWKLTEESKEKRRKKLKGRKRSLEARLSIGKGRTGLKFSEEHKFNMSLSRKIPVERLDEKTEELIDGWDSARDVEKILKIANSSISACCHGKQKTAGGFKWRFKKI